MEATTNKFHKIIFIILAIITITIAILNNQYNRANAATTGPYYTNEGKEYYLVDTIAGVKQLITTGWVSAQYEMFPRFRIRNNGENTNKVVNLPGFCLDSSKGFAGDPSLGFVYTVSEYNATKTIQNQLKYIIAYNTESALKWHWTPEQQLAIWELVSAESSGTQYTRNGKSTITAFTNKQTLLKSEASTQSSTITTLSANTSVELKRLNSNWYNVKYGNKEGYIHYNDIKYDYNTSKNDLIVNRIEHNIGGYDYIKLSNRKI